MHEETAMEYTEDEGQRLVAEFMAKQAARPVKGRYPLATENSITERGGKVLATSAISTIGGRIALVGDVVRYPDGTESRIVSGAGAAHTHHGKSVALVGSELENGDKIIGPLHEGMVIIEYADQEPIKGLFDRSYVHPNQKS